MNDDLILTFSLLFRNEELWLYRDSLLTMSTSSSKFEWQPFCPVWNLLDLTWILCDCEQVRHRLMLLRITNWRYRSLRLDTVIYYNEPRFNYCDTKKHQSSESSRALEDKCRLMLVVSGLENLLCLSDHLTYWVLSKLDYGKDTDALVQYCSTMFGLQYRQYYFPYISYLN